jgi:hypothetical protein
MDDERELREDESELTGDEREPRKDEKEPRGDERESAEDERELKDHEGGGPALEQVSCCVEGKRNERNTLIQKKKGHRVERNILFQGRYKTGDVEKRTFSP